MANSLGQLFTLGRISEDFVIHGVTFKMVLLDTRILTQALEAASGLRDDVAQTIEYKRQILSRSITAINDDVYIRDQDAPEDTEINRLLDVTARLHSSIINQLYMKYEELDAKVAKEVEDDLKNSSKRRGA